MTAASVRNVLPARQPAFQAPPGPEPASRPVPAPRRRNHKCRSQIQNGSQPSSACAGRNKTAPAESRAPATTPAPQSRADPKSQDARSAGIPPGDAPHPPRHATFCLSACQSPARRQTAQDSAVVPCVRTSSYAPMLLLPMMDENQRMPGENPALHKPCSLVLPDDILPLRLATALPACPSSLPSKALRSARHAPAKDRAQNAGQAIAEAAAVRSVRCGCNPTHDRAP